MQVLLIEPDAVLAQTYQAGLERAGHTVVAVRSAQAGVHAADTRTPDLVLLELQLPLHNGIEFLYEFRSYHEWWQVPIVILSHVPPAEMAQLAVLKQELGVVRYLHKPAVTMRMLTSLVAECTPEHIGAA